MNKSIFITSTHLGCGLTSSALGLFRALQELGFKTGYFKPISSATNKNDHNEDLAINFLKSNLDNKICTPIPFHQAEHMVSKNLINELINKIISQYQEYHIDDDIVIIEGMTPDKNQTYLSRLNPMIAQALGSQIVLVSSPLNFSLKEFISRIEINLNIYKDMSNDTNILFNKMNHPEQNFKTIQLQEKINNIEKKKFQIMGILPWEKRFTAPRTIDIKKYLNAMILHTGSIETRRVENIILASEGIESILDKLKPNSLLVIPFGREDIVIAAAMAALNGLEISGLLLTGYSDLSSATNSLITSAKETGLPILLVHDDAQTTFTKLLKKQDDSDFEDTERLELVCNNLAQHIDHEHLKKIIGQPHDRRLSPHAFKYELIKKSNYSVKRIILPEGEEERTIKAAIICHEKKIAQCILLGNKQKIENIIIQNNLSKPDALEIVDPRDMVEDLVQPMLKIRAHKNLVEPIAREQLEDPIIIGTMMLATDMVDGLVAGALNTTANTIRPALQLIGVDKNRPLMSSIFFMCLPNQVLIYGDCAVNPSPSSEQLAIIAIQSANSAKLFGIEPKVAMISYSTGSSGYGSDVEKVTKAVKIAKELEPTLIIDGPLQYDAAINNEVAKKKAPNSPVAGQATVFIFPDLNTGNTTYKAVQRSANVSSIGPMLQGLKKPVNDLSRGASVEDIVYTIALTSIQCQTRA